MLYFICRNIAGFFLRLIYRINFKGTENIPSKGKLILCSNHKSLIDPILLAIPFKRQIRYMAKSELFEDHGKISSWFLYKMGAFPVQRNSGDRKSIKTALEILKQENVVGIFPQGKCVFNNEPFRPKAGVAMIAYKSKAPVLAVSIYCDGVLKPFKRTVISFGKPMEFNELFKTKKNSKSFRQAAEIIADKINGMLEEKIGD
jgi:1-acyl-sn-glycerol-3-phosphate acyltransferase